MGIIISLGLEESREYMEYSLIYRDSWMWLINQEISRNKIIRHLLRSWLIVVKQNNSSVNLRRPSMSHSLGNGDSSLTPRSQVQSLLLTETSFTFTRLYYELSPVSLTNKGSQKEKCLNLRVKLYNRSRLKLIPV